MFDFVFRCLAVSGFDLVTTQGLLRYSTVSDVLRAEAETGFTVVTILLALACGYIAGIQAGAKGFCALDVWIFALCYIVLFALSSLGYDGDVPFTLLSGLAGLAIVLMAGRQRLDPAFSYSLVKAGAAGMATFLILRMLVSSQMWVPAERITVIPEQPRTVYVLSQNGDRTVVLDATTDSIIMIRTSAIQDEAFCRVGDDSHILGVRKHHGQDAMVRCPGT
jgi:hypothetical protein